MKAILSILILSGCAEAQDSLYWECDTTSREYRAELELPPGPESPVYDSMEACAPAPDMERPAAEGGKEIFGYCVQGSLKVREGRFESRYASGRLRLRGRYHHGKKTGEWVEWFPDGKRKSVGYYVKGRLEGLNVAFYPDGKVMDEFKYRDGRIDCRDGYHRSYSKKGRLKVDFGIKDGRLVKYLFYDNQGKEISLPVILDR